MVMIMAVWSVGIGGETMIAWMALVDSMPMWVVVVVVLVVASGVTVVVTRCLFL